MKFYITGSNGFIGQHLVNYLSGKEYEVCAMVRKGSLPGFNLNKYVKVVTGDILDTHSMEVSIPDECVVINLAVNPSDPKLSHLVNIEGTRRLLSVIENKKNVKLVHMSSQATKIKSKGLYSLTKGESDELIKKSKVNWVILKPSLVYGEGEKGLFNKIKMLVKMLPMVPVFGDGKTNVYPIRILDLCKYIELVSEDRNSKEKIYDVGSLKPVTYNYFYLAILKYLDKKNPLIHIPVWVGLVGGKVFQMMKMKNPPFTVDNVLGSTQETNCDSRPIVKKYGFSPVEFDEGLKKIFNKKITRVAVVGLGKMGMVHLAVLSLLEGVEVVALIDSNIKSGSMARSMGAKGRFYTDLTEALEKERPDGVFVLTPTFTHMKILIQCLKRGISVFVEKPLCLNSDEVDRLNKSVKKYEGKVFVGYSLLYKRVVLKLKRIIESGVYGEVKSFKASYQQGEVFGPKTGWMFEKQKSGGGVLMNPGPHIFAVISYLLGVPKKVSGRVAKLYSSEVDDEANLNLDYGKFSGELFLSWSVKGIDIPKMNLEIEFEKAKIITDGKTLNTVVSGKSKVEHEEEISPLVNGLFELNPDANGEAYSTEDYLFVKALSSNKEKNDLVVSDSLDWVLKTESIIQECYKVSSEK